MTRSNALWAMCLLFALYTLGTGLFPGTVPGGIDGLALTAFLVVFALVHGAERYGWRGILVFVVICLLVSNASENLSILTGFPFGRYYYTGVLGHTSFDTLGDTTNKVITVYTVKDATTGWEVTKTVDLSHGL